MQNELKGTRKEVLNTLVDIKNKLGVVECQKAIEGYYSTKNIKHKVKQELETNERILTLVKQCTTSIIEWCEVPEYLSKNIEKKRLLSKDFDVEGMVFSMMLIIATAYRNEAMEITKVLASLSNLTPFKFSEDIPNDTELKAYKRKIKLTSSLVVFLAEHDLVDIYLASNSDNGKVSIEPTIKFSKELENHLEIVQFNLPMISKPKKIRKNVESGYLTFNSPRITNSFQYHNGEINLDLLNVVNSTAYSLNLDLLNSIEDEFSLDEDSEADEEEQRMLWENFNRVTKESTEDLIKLGNKFYFEWFYDYRGRIYSHGYHINPQGNSYRKAMIDFYNPKEIDGWQEYAEYFDFDLPEEFDYSEELIEEELEEEECEYEEEEIDEEEIDEEVEF